MKKVAFIFCSTVLLGFAALAETITYQATYEVPVATADLKPFAQFAMTVEYITQAHSKNMTVKYTLPEEITGNTKSLVFSGERQADGFFVFEGRHGKVKCLHLNFCEVSYKESKMNFNPSRSEELIRAISSNEKELAARLEVARAFQDDPFGVIHFYGPTPF